MLKILIILSCCILTVAGAMAEDFTPKTPPGWDDYPHGHTINFGLSNNNYGVASHQDAEAVIKKYSLIAVKTLVLKVKDGVLTRYIQNMQKSGLFLDISNYQKSVIVYTAASPEEVQRFLAARNDLLSPDYYCLGITALTSKEKDEEIYKAIHNGELHAAIAME